MAKDIKKLKDIHFWCIPQRLNICALQGGCGKLIKVSDPPIKRGRNILESIHRRAYPNGQKQNFKEIKITVP